MPEVRRAAGTLRSLAIIAGVALIAVCAPVHAQSGWVAVVTPGTGGTISGQRAEVSVSYSTGSSDKVTRVELDIDDTPYGVKHLADPTDRGVSSFLVDTTQLANGPHTIVVKVFSGDRLVGSASGSCRVGNQPIDVLPPVVNFVGVHKGEVLSGTAQIEVSAKDIGDEEPLVSVFIDKSLKVIKNIPPYTYAWDTRQYDNGPHVLEAYAYDAAGNKGEAPSIELMVQNPGKERLSAGTPTEKEQALAGSAEPTAKSDVAAEPEKSVEAIVPAERGSENAAGRSVEREAVVTPAANTVAARPDRPTTTRVGPGATALAEAKREELTPKTAAAQAKEPNTSLPAAAESARVSPTVIAAAPTNVMAPAAPARPSAASPAATPAAERPAVRQPEPRPVALQQTARQKLAQPKTHAPKPAKLALAPKPEPPALQPMTEPTKMMVRLQTNIRRGTMVTELRRAIESAGGGIISWDQKTRTVLAAFAGKKIRIQVHRPTASIAGQTVKLRCAPYINQRWRTVVDVGFLKSVLGPRLEVNERTRRCVIVSA